jgi:hypothetical protein
LTVLDTDGPGMISHIWFTIASNEQFHLKRIVLRIFWDGENTPSVETPVGDFSGLGLGEYHSWQSEMLSVGSIKALNCFFSMPYRRHARITVTNEELKPVRSFYYNIDLRTYAHVRPTDVFIFTRNIGKHSQTTAGRPMANRRLTRA